MHICFHFFFSLSDSYGNVQRDIYNKKGNPSYKYYYGSPPGSKWNECTISTSLSPPLLTSFLSHPSFPPLLLYLPLSLPTYLPPFPSILSHPSVPPLLLYLPLCLPFFPCGLPSFPTSTLLLHLPFPPFLSLLSSFPCLFLSLFSLILLSCFAPILSVLHPSSHPLYFLAFSPIPPLSPSLLFQSFPLFLPFVSLLHPSLQDSSAPFTLPFFHFPTFPLPPSFPSSPPQLFLLLAYLLLLFLFSHSSFSSPVIVTSFLFILIVLLHNWIDIFNSFYCIFEHITFVLYPSCGQHERSPGEDDRWCSHRRWTMIINFLL